MKTSLPDPKKDAQLAHKLIHCMNFNLLRAQKTVLVNMQSKKATTETEWNALEGIIALIDSIQDFACNEYGYNPNDIFNFTNFVDEKQKLSLTDCANIIKKSS